MSWGEPKTLAPFPESSPFHGLDVPADVTVSEQVLAQPDPDLSERTIAQSDVTVRIPMSHDVDSLNVAASSAVAFYATRRR